MQCSREVWSEVGRVLKQEVEEAEEVSSFIVSSCSLLPPFSLRWWLWLLRMLWKEQTARSCAHALVYINTRLHNHKCATCPPTTHSHTHAWSLRWITYHTTCLPERPRSLHINTRRFSSAARCQRGRPGWSPALWIRTDLDDLHHLHLSVWFSSLTDERQQNLTEVVRADGWICPGFLMSKGRA